MAAPQLKLFGSAHLSTGTLTLKFLDDKRFQLLAYLACRADWVPREQLAYLFWPDDTSGSARKNLRHLISRVRGLAWLQGFDAELEHLRWTVDSDVRAFVQASDGSAWTEALNVYLGPLMQGVQAAESPEYAAWLNAEREALHRRWHAATLAQAAALGARGEHGRHLELLERLTASDPLDEAALETYMRVAARSGQRSLALRACASYARNLDQQLALLPPAALEQLAELIRHQPLPDPDPPISLPPPAPISEWPALPRFGTALVGRQLALLQVQSHLDRSDGGLVTLVGPGGVGKTRIALQVAQARLTPQPGQPTGQPPGQVAFVNLVPLSTPGAIPTAVAESLGLALSGPDTPLTQVIRAIGERRTLIVIDNIEHLLPGKVYLGELLLHCPKLHLLVTSREPTGLSGEQVLPVRAFSVPEDDDVSAGQIATLEAVQLFEQHARRVRPEFTLSAENHRTVLQICRLVDGLPLGIELAAVWVRAMPLAEIERELAGSLDFLNRTGPDQAERHQGLRAVFEHSWALLTPEEGLALCRLSVFRGGFTRDAVRQAAQVPLPVLGSLIDKSLLSLNAQGRYRRHRLLLGYMSEKLEELPQEALQATLNHAQYYFRVLQDGLDGIRGPASRSALDGLDLEFENVRTAWQFAADGRKVALLRAGAEALMRYFDARGRYQEAAEMLGEAAARLDPAVPDEAAALGTLLVHQSKFLERRGLLDAATRTAQEGLQLLAPLEERETTIWGLGTLGTLSAARGEHEASLRWRAEALALARALGNERLTAVCLGWASLSQLNLGQQEAAGRSVREAIYLFRRLGNHIGVLFNLNALADQLLKRSEPQEALTLYREALELAQASGELSQLPDLLTGMANCLLRPGQLDQAEAYIRRALDLKAELASSSPVLRSDLLLVLAEIRVAQGQTLEARAHLQDALGPVWEAQELNMTMRVLLQWATLGGGEVAGDAALRLKLLSAVAGHPGSRSADRALAVAWLSNLKSASPGPGASTDLSALVRHLLFG